MSGTIAIVAGVIAVLAFVALLAVGAHAVMHPGLSRRQEGKHIAAGVVYFLICSLSFLTFLFSGIVWIVEQLT